MKKKELKYKIAFLEKRLKPKPKGTAKKAFNKFWNSIDSDKLNIKTIASLSFDAGHALRHKQEDKTK